MFKPGVPQPKVPPKSPGKASLEDAKARVAALRKPKKPAPVMPDTDGDGY